MNQSFEQEVGVEAEAEAEAGVEDVYLPTTETLAKMVPPKNVAHNLPRNKMILTLHVLHGWSIQKIAELYNLSIPMVKRILKQTKSEGYLRELEEVIEKNFDALFGKYVKTLSDAMDSNDMQVALAGCALFQKSHQRFKETMGKNTTAEDVVKELIKQEDLPENVSVLKTGTNDG